MNNHERRPAPRERALQSFDRTFGGAPDFLVRAPGRVNILGGHVDYSEGFVLPGAIAPAVWLAVRQRDGGERRWRVTALDIADENHQEIDLERLSGPPAERASSWIDYPGGVAWVMATGGGVVDAIELPTLEVVMASDLPMGAGVSSSAAVEMAFVTAVEHATGVSVPGVDKARIGRAVENDYLGVQSGIMDQYASVHGEEGHLLLIDCRSLTHRQIPLSDSVSVLIADTRVRRRLVGSDFNSRRGQCEQAVELLNEARPELALATLRDVNVDDFDPLAKLLPEPLDRRARHAVEEIARVLSGAEALERGDLAALGERMKGSHRSSRDNYEVTIPELDLLAETAWSVEGCYGARVAGGGFGGCVLALVESDAIESLRGRMAEEFEREFGVEPGFFETRIGAGVSVC